MVSIHCKKLVVRELERLEVKVLEINLGVVKFQEKLTANQLSSLKHILPKFGIGIVDVVSSDLLDRIFESINELIYINPKMPRQNYPAYLKKELGFNYYETMNLFSDVNGMNLHQYIIIQQVERIKELILYEDYKIQEIAAMFYYKNGRQLTKTFKEVTGLAPFYYKKLKEKRFELVRSKHH